MEQAADREREAQRLKQDRERAEAIIQKLNAYNPHESALSPWELMEIAFPKVDNVLPALPVGARSSQDWTTSDIQKAVARLDTDQYSTGNLREMVVKLDIDERLAISSGGSWDNPATKRFLISPDNRWTKNDLLDGQPQTKYEVISLRAAKEKGRAAFYQAAVGMLIRSFAETEELRQIHDDALAAKRSFAGSERSLADNFNEAIWNRIKSSPTESAVLVREAFDVLNFPLQARCGRKT
ncbi:MAG: hypothetical protein DI543_01215 [Bradyrhizobium icense]|nr:MAG: hypothetical protein DI543_01215 [Bradyrhizobium icense]